MLRQRIGDRVANLESGFASLNGTVTSLSDDVQDMRSSVGDLGGKIDKLADGINATGERAAQRANAVRDEMSEAADRRSRQTSEILKTGLALLGGIGIVVTALTGPWKERLETTATGQAADTAAIAAVREVLAQQGAGIGRNSEAIATARDFNRERDQHITDIDRRVSHIEGRFRLP